MTFQNILNQIVESINTHSQRTFFWVKAHPISYHELAIAISSIRRQLNPLNSNESNIGVVLNDDYLTYAALIAIWLEGKAYIPINPELPSERNSAILDQAAVNILLNSGNSIIEKVASTRNLLEINTSQLTEEPLNLSVKTVSEGALAYILFTSGSTGIPKGVPISRSNVAQFMEGVDAMNMHFSHEDKFLQMFDLTFDLSVWSYLQPLCVGACIYPIPHGEIKYMAAYEIIEEEEITVALMVPSILNFLRPYFADLDFPKMRYSLFCGEALYGDVVKEWATIVSNAKIYNVYGPTEATIFCSQYEIPKDGEICCNNGIVTIGLPLKNTQLIVVNENFEPAKTGEFGELCIGGYQVTPGYICNESLNNSAFFEYNNHRYYRSGDICFIDDVENFMYSGRLDSQIKIQGFRIELSEIEFQARAIVEPFGAAAIAIENQNGTVEIHLFVNNLNGDITTINALLKQKLPNYMMPKQIHKIDAFPLNVNGKIDRKSLKSTLNK